MVITGRVLLGWVVALLQGLVAAENKTLRVSFVSELSGGNAYPAFAVGFRDFAVPYLREHGGISLGNSTFNIEVHTCDTASDAEQAAACVEAAGRGEDIDGNQIGEIDLVIAGTSRTNQAIIDASQALGIPNVHASGGNPTMWKAENTYAYGMHLPFIWYTRGVFSLANIRGLQKAAIIRSAAHGFSRTSCIAALAWAQENGIGIIGPTVAWCKANAHLTGQCRLVNNSYGERCVCGYQSDVDGLSLTYNIEEVNTFYELDETKIGNGVLVGAVDVSTTLFIRGMLDDMRSQGDVEALLNFAYEWHNAINALWQADMSPKLLFGWQGGVVPAWAEDSTGTTNTTHGLWAVGFGQWHQAMSFSDPLFGSNAEAVAAYEEQTGDFLGYDAAGAVAIGSLLFKVISSYVDEAFPTMALQERRDALRDGIGQMNDETLWGLIRFNRYNQNNGRGTAVWQILPEIDEGGQEIIAQRCVLPQDAAEVQLQIPFPTWESRFGCPSGTFNTGSSCEPCNPGTSKGNRSEGLWPSLCSPCIEPFGTLADEVGAVECSSCPAGRSNEGGFPVGICSLCPAGTAYNPVNSTTAECHRCPAGTYASSPLGADHCEPCQLGTFMRDVAATACELCAEGFHASERGRTVCSRCAVGRFQSLTGQPECDLCGDTVAKGSVTAESASVSAVDCLCPFGTYLLTDADAGLDSEGENATEWAGVCAGCPSGLLCELGRGEPLQKAGFYGGRPAHDGGAPSFVVACRNTEVCPRGLALGECPLHRTGLACDKCESDHTEDGNECSSCAGRLVWLPLVLLIMGGVLAIVSIWLWAAYAPPSVMTQDVLTVTITGSILINCIQAFSVFSKLSINWIEPMKTLQRITSIFTLRVDFLNPGCIFQNNDPVLDYLGALVLYMIFALILFICMLVPAPAIFERWRFGRRNAITWDKIWNAQGLCMLVAYLSLSVASVMPWQCEDNPDGTQSISSERSILCWEGDRHPQMLALSLFGILGYMALFLSVVSHAVVVYPQKIRQVDGTNFVRRYEFLFKRFDSKRYYYALMYLVRNLFIALIPVVFASEAELQVLTMMIIVVAGGFIQVRLWPWRTPSCNYADAGFSMGLVIMLCAGLILFDLDSRNGEQVVQVVMIVVICSCFGFAFCMIAFQMKRMLYPNLKYGIFLSHHKGAAQVLARWFKIQMIANTKDGVFLDSDELDELGALLHTVAKETKNLVVLASSETLWRMWCACEVVTAYQFKVNFVVVASEDYAPPSPQKLMDVSSAWTDNQKSELQALGVTFEQMQEAFTYFTKLQKLELRRKQVESQQPNGKDTQQAARCYDFMKASDRGALVEAVVGECTRLRRGMSHKLGSRQSKLRADGGGPGDQANAITGTTLLCNPEDPEAVCCAEVIKLLLQTDCNYTATPLSYGLHAALAELLDTKLLLPLLTQGCLVQVFFADVVVQAHRTQVGMIPIVADSRFSFPDPQAMRNVSLQPKDGTEHLSNVTSADITEAYRTLFTTIALKFTEHGSQTIQQAEIISIARRCENKEKVLDKQKSSKQTTLATTILRGSQSKSDGTVKGSIGTEVEVFSVHAEPQERWAEDV